MLARWFVLGVQILQGMVRISEIANALQKFFHAGLSAVCLFYNDAAIRCHFDDDLTCFEVVVLRVPVFSGGTQQLQQLLLVGGIENSVEARRPPCRAVQRH